MVAGGEIRGGKPTGIHLTWQHRMGCPPPDAEGTAAAWDDPPAFMEETGCEKVPRRGNKCPRAGSCLLGSASMRWFGSRQKVEQLVTAFYEPLYRYAYRL